MASITKTAPWLIGCQGMLGQQIAQEFHRHNLSPYTSDIEVDIIDFEQLRKFARQHFISWIINCSAYTKVDQAEDEKDMAFALNETGVANLARLAIELDAPLFHISTDYVFDGRKKDPYIEDDKTNPLSVYGKSKRAGEEAILRLNPRYIILRISWLYGIYGKNFVETILRLLKIQPHLRVVNDQHGSPTYAGQLAANIIRLILTPPPMINWGIYHYADSGTITWFEFAQAIRQHSIDAGIIGNPPEIDPITTAEFPLPAPRPQNSCFDTSKVRQQLGFVTLPWQQNLQQYFKERNNLNQKG